MVEIQGLKEKRLVVARYFILKRDRGEAYNENDIFYMWNNWFRRDFRLNRSNKFKLRNGALCLTDYENYKKYHDPAADELIEDYNQTWKSIFEWITKYVFSHDLKKCDADLARVRGKQEKNLKRICREIDCFSKLLRAPKKQLAVYMIQKKGFGKQGCYSRMCQAVKDYRKHGNRKSGAV